MPFPRLAILLLLFVSKARVNTGKCREAAQKSCHLEEEDISSINHQHPLTREGFQKYGQSTSKIQFGQPPSENTSNKPTKTSIKKEYSRLLNSSVAQVLGDASKKKHSHKTERGNGQERRLLKHPFHPFHFESSFRGISLAKGKENQKHEIVAKDRILDQSDSGKIRQHKEVTNVSATCTIITPCPLLNRQSISPSSSLPRLLSRFIMSNPQAIPVSAFPFPQVTRIRYPISPLVLPLLIERTKLPSRATGSHREPKTSVPIKEGSASNFNFKALPSHEVDLLPQHPLTDKLPKLKRPAREAKWEGDSRYHAFHQFHFVPRKRRPPAKFFDKIPLPPPRQPSPQVIPPLTPPSRIPGSPPPSRPPVPPPPSIPPGLPPSIIPPGSPPPSRPLVPPPPTRPPGSPPPSLHERKRPDIDDSAPGGETARRRPTPFPIRYPEETDY